MAGNTVTIQIQMDTELKTQADALFSDLGMDLETAFHLFVRQSLREGRIPFEANPEQPNPETGCCHAGSGTNRKRSVCKGVQGPGRTVRRSETITGTACSEKTAKQSGGERRWIEIRKQGGILQKALTAVRSMTSFFKFASSIM